MMHRSPPPPGTPLIGVVLLFSALFRGLIFMGLLATRTWVVPIAGAEACSLFALAIGATRRQRWAKTLALLYLIASTIILLFIWFYSEVRNIALLDVLINLLLIWYMGAPEVEQRNS